MKRPGNRNRIGPVYAGRQQGNNQEKQQTRQHHNRHTYDGHQAQPKQQRLPLLLLLLLLPLLLLLLLLARAVFPCFFHVLFGASMAIQRWLNCGEQAVQGQLCKPVVATNDLRLQAQAFLRPDKNKTAEQLTVAYFAVCICFDCCQTMRVCSYVGV